MGNFIAIILARKNSKRIINKNLKKINGRSLVEITILNAKKSKIFKNIIVSSDDKRIINIAKKCKVNFYFRPEFVSMDKTSSEKTIIYTLKKKLDKKDLKGKTCIMLLQVTSPLRSAEDIIAAAKLYSRKKLDSLFSCYKSQEFLWNYKKKIKSVNYNYKKRPRSQNLKNLIFENGAIYIFNLIKFLKYKNRLFGRIGFYIMSKYNSIDIDNYEDLKVARKIYRS